MLSRAATQSLRDEVALALRRRTPHEPRLAGALRALAPESPVALGILAEVAGVLARRQTFDRPLWSASVRALAEAADARVKPVLATALAAEGAGGFATLAAAAVAKGAPVGPVLSKLAAGRGAHLAFAAEMARVVRGESGGQALGDLAAMIKESHRIGLAVELFVPLAREAKLPAPVATPCRVLRSAERHLGRWLVLGEVGARAGDSSPLDEARAAADEGATSARAAWAFVAWALGPGGPAPTARPTLELMARLSDRPSADKDTGFLFRVAEARGAAARPVLEAVLKGGALEDGASIRAARHLARDHGRADLVAALATAARSAKEDRLRALAAAAWHDAAPGPEPLAALAALDAGASPSAIAWASLARARAARGGAVVQDLAYRRIELGWVE